MSRYQNNKISTTTSPHPRPSSPETSGPEKTNQDGGDDEESSLVIPLVAAAAVLFCLLLTVVAIVIVCKRQNRYTPVNNMPKNMNESLELFLLDRNSDFR